MAEPDNLVLVLLREMREEMVTQAQCGELQQRLDGLDQRLDRIEKRLDVMHANGMKALKSFIGHRTMVEHTFADFSTQLNKPEARVATLEAAGA